MLIYLGSLRVQHMRCVGIMDRGVCACICGLFASDVVLATLLVWGSTWL